MFEAVFFDFDGVVLDSMPIRDLGFETILEGHPPAAVEKLMAFHRLNAGLSRFVKIRYFYEEILGEEVTEAQVQALANQFSQMMRSTLTDKSYLIQDCVSFLKRFQGRAPMHIVSGSEQNELRFLCKTLEVEQYFDTIHGSPIHKNELVAAVLRERSYSADKCILIGDSITDFRAAESNGLEFYGYNNPALKDVSQNYIETFATFLND